MGITDNYINFAYAIAVGLGIAAATLVARRAGEKDTEGMGRTAHYIILLAFFFAVLIGEFPACLPRKLLGSSGSVQMSYPMDYHFRVWYF